MAKSHVGSVIMVLGILVPLAFSQSATAQWGGNGYYGGWGAYPFDTASGYNTTRDIAAQTQEQAARQAAAQQAAIQSNINTALSNQTNQRMAAMSNQRQDYRDWWFTTSQQQTAERQAREASYRPPPATFASVSSSSFEPSAATSGAAARAQRADDVIKWPAIFYDRRFDALRAQVEAPYRRGNGKVLGTPTAADYRNIVKAAQQMKVVLKQMADEISARDYLDADADLDGLIAQANGRAEKLEGAATPR